MGQEHLFESDRAHARLLIKLPGDTCAELAFEPGDRKPNAKNDKERFGEVDVSSAFVLHSCKGLTLDQITKAVIDSESYVRRRVGKRGIWLKMDRLSIRQKEQVVELQATAFKSLDVETLKLLVEKKGGTVTEGDTKESLVAQLLAFQAGPGAKVKEIEPPEESEPPAVERKKPGPKPKARPPAGADDGAKPATAVVS